MVIVMNKKGFAISVILYSIVFMIITILYMLLSIVKTRYVVTDKLRENIVSDLNDIETVLVNDVSKETCELVPSSNDYSANLELTIEVSNDKDKLYSFDNVNWGNEKTILVTSSGLYTAYFKDSVNNAIGSCSVFVTSRTEYRYRDCADNHKQFGLWYLSKEEFVNSCNPVDKVDAENKKETLYRDCNSANEANCSGTSPCYLMEEYTRGVSCNFSNESWSSYDVNRPNSSLTTEIQSTTTYKIK